MDGYIFSNRPSDFIYSSFSVFPYCDYGDTTVCELLCKKTPIWGIGSSDSSSIFGESGYRSSNSLNYYCMNCGRRHNQFACPECGSKMKRVGYLLSIQLIWRPYSVKDTSKNIARMGTQSTIEVGFVRLQNLHAILL